MKVLVIGGSYFLGRWFVELAHKTHEITLFNRGNQPLHMEDVEEIVGDRKEIESFVSLRDRSFDAVVDFCAYEKGDIERIVNALSGQVKQYLFVSTVDVYERGLGVLLDESGPLETRNFGEQEGNYILGKVALERELQKLSETQGIHTTVFRPAFIYGPGNYAPREGMYFHWIKEAGQILHPQDATGSFQMVYVVDVARAILAAIGNEEAFDEVYNLAPDQMETYDSFVEALKQCMEIPFTCVPVPVQVILEKGIPLPFPLTKEESNFYDGKKVLALIGEYQSLVEGLRITASGAI